MMIPVTEAERRASFLKAIGDYHPLTKSIISCIHNDPSRRMHASEIVEHMSEIVAQFPRKHLDLIEHISRAKETTQLRPQDEEYEDNEEYEDIMINKRESQKEKLQQVNNDQGSQ